jgi:hypothetical protein
MIRRPYRPCQPTARVAFDPDRWFLAAAAVVTVLIELLVGGCLGDGLYVSFDGASLQYKLRAPRENGDHVVYLDPGMIAELERFTRRVVTAAHLYQESKYREARDLAAKGGAP